MGEDPEPLHATQELATAEEECLGVDVTLLAIVEDELPIMEHMKKKSRRIAADYPSYMEEEEISQRDNQESLEGEKDKKS